VRRYPDDPLGWYQLGDARFHSGYLGEYEHEDIITPFLEAVRLDPSLALGLYHALDLALEMDDRPLFESLLEQYATVAPPQRTANRHQQAAIRWTAPDSVLPLFVASIRDFQPGEDRSLISELVGALGRRARLDPRIDPAVYPAAMDSLARIFARDEYWRGRGNILRLVGIGALGQWEPYLAQLDSLQAGLPASDRARTRLFQAIEGRLPRDLVAEDLERVRADHATDPDANSAVLRHYFHWIGDHATARQFRPPPPR
jgi:hypothetical protein